MTALARIPRLLAKSRAHDRRCLAALAEHFPAAMQGPPLSLEPAQHDPAGMGRDQSSLGEL